MEHANFVHLHLHSQYSLLDGAIKLDDLVNYLQQNTEFGDFYDKVLEYRQTYGVSS